MSNRTKAVAPQLAAVDGLLHADDLLRGVRHLLVGCSGGGDSVALVDILRQLRSHLRLTLVHCDHQARPESAEDAVFVGEYAASLGLDCRIVPSALPLGSTGSREAGWRNLRRDAFREAMDELGADAVALGHTADDQAETVLLNLARGSGLRGLAAMRSRVDHDGLVILRPLLEMRRRALRHYAHERGLEWRRDASNDDVAFSRNRIRAGVVPDLEAIAPGAVANIARLAGIVREHELYLEAEAEAARSECELDESFPGGLAFAAARLADLPRPVAMTLLREAFRSLRGHLHGITKEHLDAVLDDVVGGRQSAADIPGIRARLEGEKLRLLPLQGRQLRGSDREQAS
jgi:tRNA(Ile)-lysidine synthase